MKKTLLILPALCSLAFLYGCDQTPDVSSDSEKPTSLSEEILNAFKNGSLSFEGSRTTSYLTGDKVEEEGKESLFIGPNSYRFYEFSDTTESIVTDKTYYKGAEGKAVSSEVNFLNKVETIQVQGGNVDFASSFYNPFDGLSLADFSLEGEDRYILAEEKEDAFWKPLAFYGETLLNLKVTPYTDGTMKIVAQSRGASNDYIANIDGVLSVAKEKDIPALTPYETKDYHKNLQAAYDAMVKAKNFTFKRTRTPVSIDTVETEKYDVKISVDTPKAVVFYQNGVTSGIARFGDEEDYRFTVDSENKVTRGQSDALKLPFNTPTVKAEVFEKIDDAHFAARTPELAKTIAGFLVEKTEEALLIDGSLFGDAGCDELILETDGNKTLKGFTYYINRPQESGGVYREKNEIEIVDVGSTDIPYDFSEGKVTEPDFDFAPFVGSFEGYNVEPSATDNGIHTFAMAEDHSMTLDGEKLTFIAKVYQTSSMGSSFNAKWGESKYVQVAVNENGLSVRAATDGTFTQMDLSFQLKMAKNEGTALSWKDLVNSYGWSFEDDDEWVYILKMDTPFSLSLSKEERVDGSLEQVSKDVSNLAYESNVLTFDSMGLSFEARFYSKKQAIIKTADNSIKALMNPYSGY